MILTSEQHAEHRFAGQNSQHLGKQKENILVLWQRTQAPFKSQFGLKKSRFITSDEFYQATITRYFGDTALIGIKRTKNDIRQLRYVGPRN